ncbi:MAG: AMP-binding protein, partial [Synechococcales cyanobacterium CRU_2_2]|nr:AMP-binding protein [Synechococcales cyanobacterium CRU_2_2]
PIGVPGELYLSGAGLARGYWNRPELTAETFIPNPFGPGRLYKTGDRVRYRASRELDYLGRSDGQIKLRGFRIELGEIETVLLRHPEVRQALIVARSDDHQNPEHQQLVAYVVPQPHALPEPAALKSFLKQHLPDYMVPAWVVLLEEMPLLPNGKRDRKALPAPTPVIMSGQRLPQTEIERQFQQIWQPLLRVESVGLQDNFFELGGDSILAIQFIAKARQLGYQLTPRQLFKIRLWPS